jgi:tetratricopeptide (TPR) repeat protein
MTDSATAVSGDSYHPLFISHKQKDAHLAKELSKIFEERTRNIRCFISAEIGFGTDYRDKILEAIMKSKSLVLLYLDEEEDWGWCLYETGIFVALGRMEEEGTRKTICLHHSESHSPDPIADLQSVKVEVDSIETWLQHLYQEAREPSTREQILKDAQRIYEVLHKKRRTLFSEKERVLRINVPDQSKAKEYALPSDACFKGTRQLMQEIFGINNDNITWGNLERQLEQNENSADANKITIKEISRALYYLSCNRRIRPLQGVLFTGDGPTRWRPVLYRVDEERARELNAEILTVEDVGGQLQNVDIRLRSLLASIRLAVRMRYEIINPFARNIKELSQDSYTLRKDIQTCLNNIFIEAEFRQTYKPEDLIDSFEGSERIEIRSMIDDSRSAIRRLWSSLGFESSPVSFDEVSDILMTPAEIKDCSESLSVLDGLNARFLRKVWLQAGILIERDLEEPLGAAEGDQRTGKAETASTRQQAEQQIGFNFLAKCRAIGLSAVYQSRAHAVDDIIADIRHSETGCHLYAAITFPELFDANRNRFVDALVEAATRSSKGTADSRYKLTFTCLNWSKKGPNDLLNLWQKREGRDEIEDYYPDWELGHRQFKNVATATAELIARKLEYFIDGQPDLQMAYDSCIEIQHRVFKDYACPRAMCVIDDRIYVGLYNWGQQHGTNNPAFRLMAGGGWTEVFLNEVTKLHESYSVVEETFGAKSRVEHARSYHHLGMLAQQRANMTAAEGWYRQSLELAEALGDRPIMASNYHQLGRIAQQRGDFDAAEAWARRSLEAAEALGDRPLMVNSCAQLGRIAQNRGDLDAAEAWARRSLEVAEALGDHPGMADSYVQLGRIAQLRGDLIAAEKAGGQALVLYRKLSAQQPDAFQPSLAMSLNDLASVLNDLGRREAALAAAREAAALYRELSTRRPEPFRPALAISLSNLANLLNDVGQRAPALATADEGVALYRELSARSPDAFRPDLARSLISRAELLNDLDRCELAQTDAEEAVTLYRELSSQRPDVFQHALAGALNTLSLILTEAGRPVAALEATEKARAQDPFTKLESNKAELDTILFERNRESRFRIIRLDFEGTRFFGDCTWSLAPNFNVLLGRNGYGKSYVLHAIAALLASDHRIMSDLFPASDGKQRIVLTIDYQRHISGKLPEGSLWSDAGVKQTYLEFQNAGARTRQTVGLWSRTGPVPLLAIPDLRFVDQAGLGVAAGTGELNDLVRSGATHFLRNQPIVGLVHTMLYQLCLDYLECRTFELPSIQLLNRTITRLSGAPFFVKEIRRSQSTAQFEIQVVSEGLGDHPIPLQRASQGTLSTVAVLGLIERFLRGLVPGTSPQEDVCARPAIVIIDELDAHLHPSWQRVIVPVLRETFPNVQFITSAHSPLIIAECFENEVAVLRKTQSEQRFLIQSDPLLIGEDLQTIMREIFETDPTSSTLNKYLTLLGDRANLQKSIKKLSDKDSRTSEEEMELQRAELELSRLNRAENSQQLQIRIEDFEEYEAALKARVGMLEAQVKTLEAQIKETRT